MSNLSAFPPAMVDLDGVPASDRQRIVIVGRSELDQIAEAWRRSTQNGGEDVSAELNKLDMSASVIGSVEKIWKGYCDLTKHGHRWVLIASEAADLFSFPVEPATHGSVFVLHPLSATCYLPVGLFHEYLLEEKFAEAIRVVQSLGAATLEVEHRSSRELERGFGFSVSLPPYVDLQFGGAGKSEEVVEMKYRGLYDAPSLPSLPSDTVWYRNEPLWRAVADGRLNHGLRNFVLEVTQRSNFGVDRGLHGAVTSAGFPCGAWSEKALEVSWYIHGEFSAGFPHGDLFAEDAIDEASISLESDRGLNAQEATPVESPADRLRRQHWGHAEHPANRLELMHLALQVVLHSGPVLTDDIVKEVAREYEQSATDELRSAVIRALRATKLANGLRYDKESDTWDSEHRAAN